MSFLKYCLLLILVACSVPMTGELVPTTGEDVDNNLEKAYFAGGCFWCMEPPFEALEGVNAAVSGYMGGTVENPTYE